jgi:cellulose synthase/poly-beta-1,6-N-acetylglucosamine synthase-like glycosyltransferase
MLVLHIIIVCYLFLSVLSYGSLMLYYRNGIKNTYRAIDEINRPSVFISVVVCFRNEELHLAHLLESLLQQDYPISQFEILMYNDASTDGSLAAIKNIQAQQKQLNIMCIDVLHDRGVNSAKKWAINHAADHSKANLILVTDADCFLNKKWLRSMAQCYTENNAYMIAAPVAIVKRLGWINTLQNLEMQALTAVTAGAFGHKHAIMCSGANLAFDRRTFLALNPYKDNLHISSGDDMFLMMAMQKEHHQKMYFITHQNAVVYTKAKNKISEYLHQRVRWASKSKSYSHSFVNLVALLVLNLNMAVVLSPLMIIVIGWWQGLVLFFCLIGLKYTAESLLLLKYSKALKIRVEYLKLFLFQYVEAFLTILIAVKSIKGSYIWKGRKQAF